MNKENYIEEIRPHDSAYKHVSGYAEYTDDIKEPYDTLFGAIGWSKKAHAKIKKIDLNEVINSEGVVSVVNYLDIPGRNDVGPVFDGDPIFEGFFDQPAPSVLIDPLIDLPFLDFDFLPFMLFDFPKLGRINFLRPPPENLESRDLLIRALHFLRALKSSWMIC